MIAGEANMTDGIESSGINHLWGLEDRLNHVLKPVTPDPVFVNSLKLKLSRTPSVFLEQSRKYDGLHAILIGLAAGLLGYWLYRKFSK